MSTLPAKENTHEQVVSVLKLLASRMQWSTARHLLSSTSLHVSRGWKETIDRIRGEVDCKAVWTKDYDILSNAAILHTYVGNKRVSLFDLRNQNQDDRLRILTWARESAIGDLSEALASRPFDLLDAPTGKEELAPFKDTQPIVIATNFEREKLYLQFFSTRSYVHREPLDISKMSSAQQDFFNEYEELIGVKRKSVPCFDTVVIDTKNELIEVRIDFQPGMAEDKNTPAFDRVIAQLNRIATKFIGHTAAGAGLVNLHPAINPMYLDDECGRVTALGFVATGKESSSNNQGKIHRTKTKDFRKDEFHVGGKHHVERIDPYAIGITWPASSRKNDLYLELKGNVRAIYAGKLNAVTVAEVVGCINESDFDFVVGHVLGRLKRKKK